MRTKTPTLSWMVIALCCLGFVLPTVGTAQRTGKIAPGIESAMLMEDWTAVITLLGSEENLSPVLQLLKAHALLALNRNNDSVCLFLQGRSSRYAGTTTDLRHTGQSADAPSAVSGALTRCWQCGQ